MIIAIGIMAMVGILTAIDALKTSINSEFSRMGANTFTLRSRSNSVRVGEHGGKAKAYRVIEYREAKEFVERFDFPSVRSISTILSFNSTVRSKTEKTNPNVRIYGGDEYYLTTAGYEVSEGRNFSNMEIEEARNVAIIGKEIADMLFPNSTALNQGISVRGVRFIVIGVLKEKGSSIGFGGDRNVIAPITAIRNMPSMSPLRYTASVSVNGPEQLGIAVSEATGLFRVIRNIPLAAEEDFEIRRSDSLASRLIENLSFVTIAATIIGFITLLGAAIGLMNIMLVSVTERTKEIGTRKALGANQNMIRLQFLTEAIVICQIGGLFGIVFGILIGNAVSLLFDSGFIIPWAWILLGVSMCMVVGVMAGFYPANKAARLDPIGALRYE